LNCKKAKGLPAFHYCLQTNFTAVKPAGKLKAKGKRLKAKGKRLKAKGKKFYNYFSKLFFHLIL